mmetsp:Transcript_22080/g.38181  ORF Transcript_22080/g.38181 Transcript_22080/m.38181 type:complete len:81 (+) Transcript_22080:529-771(+)
MPTRGVTWAGATGGLNDGTRASVGTGPPAIGAGEGLRVRGVMKEGTLTNGLFGAGEAERARWAPCDGGGAGARLVVVVVY